MPNVMNVTLDTSSSPNQLNVDDSGNQNQIGQSQSAQTIQWQLTGNAATGSFVAMSDPNPGFAWVGAGTPADGIFSTPTLGANGNSLSMTDLNDSSSTKGTWTYILRANIGGTVYSTGVTTIDGTVKDPKIIND